MTAYDLAASPLPMIAPVVSMRQTGWKQKQQEVRLRSDSTV